MTAHPWRAQRATSLALVLVVAKIAGAWGRDLPASLWLAPALFWDDAAAGILFWLIDRAAGRPRWMWVTYGALVTWAALNVPIAWMLSSPMTWSMIRGARGPLADSVRDQLTATNVAAVLALLGLAFVLPSILARTTRAVRAGLVALALVVLVTAPLGASRFDLEGVQRNALTTLITTWRPRVAAVARDVDWRRSPFAGGDVQDLTALGGAAHGMNVVLVVLE